MLQVFHNIVYGLREGTIRSDLLDDKCPQGYFFLAELCEMKTEGSNFRPICQLVRASFPGSHLSTGKSLVFRLSSVNW